MKESTQGNIFVFEKKKKQTSCSLPGGPCYLELGGEKKKTSFLCAAMLSVHSIPHGSE